MIPILIVFSASDLMKNTQYNLITVFIVERYSQRSLDLLFWPRKN